MSRKKDVLLILILIVASAYVVYAATYTIKSPEVTVEVTDYTLTLSRNVTECVVGDKVRFYGTLEKNGTPIMSQNVTLHYNTTIWTGLSDLTDSNGNYTMVWTATQLGNFGFYTQVEIP